MYSDITGHSIILASIIIGAIVGAVVGGGAGAYISKKKTGKVNGWAVVAWIDKDTVIINGIQLNIRRDGYNFRLFW